MRFNGQKGGPAEHCGVRSGHSETQKDTAGHPLHPDLSPAVSTMSCHWTRIDWDERVRLTNCATLPHLNQIQAQVMAPKQVLWRWGSGEAAGADTLEAVATNLHTGGPGHRVALYWTEAAVEFGSPLGD